MLSSSNLPTSSLMQGPGNVSTGAPSTGIGMDPVTISLIAASILPKLFGHSDAPLKSFKGSGITDPKIALSEAMGAAQSQLAATKARQPVQLRSNVAPPPKPIQIPGLSFQIGGGLADLPFQQPIFPQSTPTPSTQAEFKGGGIRLRSPF